MMMTERGLVAPAADGSVLAQWETMFTAAAAALAGHVKVVGFDADRAWKNWLGSRLSARSTRTVAVVWGVAVRSNLLGRSLISQSAGISIGIASSATSNRWVLERDT
ncbi:hypothetical protein GCM10010282_66210 [Streptomyces roseolus]|nr:hypothetical protein GCM10010282_66210 [Streptomyces roseolus]